MAVAALEHINVCTPDVAGTAAFLADVLGMTVTASPGVNDVARAAWLLDERGVAIIHLALPEIMARAPGGAPTGRGSGAIHHVALRCTDYAGTIDRLTARGAAFEAFGNRAPRVVFATDPNGLRLELNFPD